MIWNEKPKKKKKVYGPEKPPYVDPLSPIERWFSRLPSRYLENECHCGSGKPVLYWHREEGTGCEDCYDPGYMTEIVRATIWNFCHKFDLSKEVQDEIWRKYEGMK